MQKPLEIEYSSQQANKPKNYKVKNSEWYCSRCEIYCNSKSQFEVHMVSTKHNLIENRTDSQMEIDNQIKPCMHSISTPKIPSLSNSSDDHVHTLENSFDSFLNEKKVHEINISKSFNDFEIAKQFKIDAKAYLIPEDKKMGKFEKFGFYCSKCNAYMTGQIQLVMHIKGAKHQYYSPGEVPNYQPSKVFNPNFMRRRFNSHQCGYNYYAKSSNIKLGFSNSFFGVSPFVSSHQSSFSTAQTILMAQTAAAIANQRRAFMKSMASAAADAALTTSQNLLQNQSPYLNYSDYAAFNSPLQSIHSSAHPIPQIKPDSSAYRHHLHQLAFPDAFNFQNYGHLPAQIGSNQIFSIQMPTNPENCHIPQIYSSKDGVMPNQNGYSPVQQPSVTSNSLAQVPVQAQNHSAVFFIDSSQMSSKKPCSSSELVPFSPNINNHHSIATFNNSGNIKSNEMFHKPCETCANENSPQPGVFNHISSQGHFAVVPSVKHDQPIYFRQCQQNSNSEFLSSTHPLVHSNSTLTHQKLINY